MDAAEILKNLDEIGCKLSDLHDSVMLQIDNIKEFRHTYIHRI